MTLSRGYTFGSTEVVTNTKLHNLVDLASGTDIVNADVKSGAAIVEAKISFDGSTAVLVGTTQTISGQKDFTGGIKIGGTLLAPSITELNYVDGVTSAIQTQLNTKIASGDSAGGDLTGTYPNPTHATAIPKNVQVFTSSGTWTRPAGIDYVLVKVWGGGGGGGGARAGEANGGGGGGGGYSEGLVTVTGNVTVTVGAAGAAGTNGTGTAGGTGGTSSFAGSTTPQATGGVGGNPNGGTGGAGGAGSGGTVNLTGGSGGGSAIHSGAGGGSPMGGAGGPRVTAGTRPGGGGGGVEGVGSGTAGAAGLVIVYY